MKIIAHSETLKPACKAAASLAPGTGKIPQLECVRIDVTEKETEISCSNMTESLRLKLDVGGEPGSVFVPAVNLMRTIKEAKKQDVTISWDGEKLYAKVKFGRTTVKLPTEDPNNQRVMRRFDPDKKFTSMPGADLSALIKRTAFSVQTDFASRTLGGVSVQVTADKLELAATDGRRMAVAIKEVETEGKPTSAIIPPMTTKSLLALFNEGEALHLQVAGNALVFHGSKGEVTKRLISGKFPPYQSHVPWTSPYETKINRKEFIDLLKLASLLKVAGGVEAVFTFADNELQLAVSALVEGVMTSSMAIDWPHPEVKINLEHTFVDEALKSVESEEVIIGLEASLRPLTIREITDDMKVISFVLPKAPA